MIRYAALLFGLVLTALGLLGFAVPSTVLSAVEFFQAGHRIYIAAAGRALIGTVLFMAAPDSRWPRALHVIAVIIVVMALLTPVSMYPMASVAWGWWPGDFVTPWALASMVLGLFVIAAVVPPRAFED